MTPYLNYAHCNDKHVQSFLHDRMPAILEGDALDSWLDNVNVPFADARIQAVLRPYGRELDIYEVLGVDMYVLECVYVCAYDVCVCVCMHMYLDLMGANWMFIRYWVCICVFV